MSYKLRVKEQGEEYEEKITIDKDKQTETIHVEAHGQSVEADVISDFKRVRIFPLHACMHLIIHTIIIALYTLPFTYCLS